MEQDSGFICGYQAEGKISLEVPKKCPFLPFLIHSYQKGMEYLPKAIALEKNIFNFFLRNSEFGEIGMHSWWKGTDPFGKEDEQMLIRRGGAPP